MINIREKISRRAGVLSIIILSIIISTGASVLADSSSANYGYFKVDSAPESGEVIFDGLSYGSTPALIKVDSDAQPFHEVIVRMDGYEEYSRQISYNPGNGETIPIVLDASHTLDNIIEFLEAN
jgi:hypothetical protein